MEISFSTWYVYWPAYDKYSQVIINSDSIAVKDNNMSLLKKKKNECL